MVPDIAAFITQAQSQPTPEVLNALSNLMKAIAPGSPPAGESSWRTPEGLKAVAAFINAIAWPALILFFILKFRAELTQFLSRVQEVDAFGIKAKIQSIVAQSAQEAEKTAPTSSGLSKAPTQDELKRAEQVETLTASAHTSVVEKEVDELAAEYESIRAAMPPGNNRTRRMEVVMSKMRTVGRAAYRLRYQLTESPSPGHRLQAVACLQVTVDFDLLEWLAERIRFEKPFIGYHAVVALNAAVADSKASAHLEALERALKLARENSRDLPTDSDRAQELAGFEKRVTALKPKN